MKSAKLKDNATLLTWLKTHGCPVDTSNIASDIEVQQQDGDDSTQLFDLPDGRAAYILDLRIVNNGRGPRSIRNVEFEMPWSNSGFQLLPDPREAGERFKNFYIFPGIGLEYPRGMVMNHLLIPNGILQPNHPTQGLLLGIGNPMSREIQHGQAFSAILTIALDSNDPSISEIELWANRGSTGVIENRKSSALNRGDVSSRQEAFNPSNPKPS